MRKNFLNKSFVCYIVLFYIYLTISRIIPISSLIAGKADTIISSIFAGAGVLIIILDVISERIVFKSKYILILSGFVAVQIISGVINFKFGVIDNIKTIIWTSIHILLIYSFFIRFGKKKGIQIFKNIFNIVNFIWIISSVFSLGQFFLQIGYHAKENANHLVRQGFIENRLFGVFLDPNFASIISLCMIFFCVFLYENNREKWKKVYSVFCIVVHYMYIVLSGSRTVLICLYVASIIFVGLKIRNFCLRKTCNIRKSVKFLFTGAVITSVIFIGMYTLCKQVLPKFTYEIEKQEHLEREEVFEEEKELLHRKDVRKDNVLNNRSTIWKEYIKSVKGKDLIFGLSPRNALKYIQTKYPDSYLAESGYRVHSDYIGVFVYTGIVGSLIIFIYAALILRKIINHIKTKKKLSDIYIMSVTLSIALAIYVLAFLDILFVNTITSVVFWLVMSVVSDDELVEM